MKLFKADADYNLILEKILDSKYFSSNSKSLLFSMIYKIEEFYDDYATIKNIDTTKDEFLNLILDTIKKYCDNIKLIEPEENDVLKKNKVLALTNEKERSLLCYPTEMSLLYGISDIMPKYFYMPDNFEYKTSFQRTLANGYIANILEILTDFSGWSWDVNSKQKSYIKDNLIYQNFVIMFGNLFMEQWRAEDSKDNSSLHEIKKYFGKTGYFDVLCKYLVIRLNSKEKTKTNKELELKKKEVETISDKISYFENIKNVKLKYLKELEKLTLILNNKELMRKEYLERNKKVEESKKYATIGVYKKMLEARKEKVVTEISRLTANMNPINYMNYKRELEKFIEINTENPQDKDETIIKLQEEFIKVLKDNCYETDDTEGLENLIFKMRYYRYLYITEELQIRDVDNLRGLLDVVTKQAIHKLVLLENIKRIAIDDNLNEEIINTILDTKIIDLKSLKFEIDIKEDSVKIKTYESEVFEKEFEIKGTFSKKNFDVKQGKIYKLFT